MHNGPWVWLKAEASWEKDQDLGNKPVGKKRASTDALPLPICSLPNPQKQLRAASTTPAQTTQSPLLSSRKHIHHKRLPCSSAPRMNIRSRQTTSNIASLLTSPTKRISPEFEQTPQAHEGQSWRALSWRASLDISCELRAGLYTLGYTSLGEKRSSSLYNDPVWEENLSWGNKFIRLSWKQVWVMSLVCYLM